MGEEISVLKQERDQYWNGTAGGKVGKFNYSHVEYKPKKEEEYFSSLVDLLLLDSEENSLRSITEGIFFKYQKEFVWSVTRVLELQGEAVNFLKLLCRPAISDMRENREETTLLEKYWTEYAQNYVANFLAPLLRKIMEEFLTQDFHTEVNPNKLKEGQFAMTNAKNLFQLVAHFLSGLIQSSHQFPVSLKIFLKYFLLTCQKHVQSQETHIHLLSTLVFQFLFSPIIEDPESFGIFASKSSNASQSLLLMSRVCVLVGKGRLSESKYLGVMEPFKQRIFTDISLFLKSLTNEVLNTSSTACSIVERNHVESTPLPALSFYSSIHFIFCFSREKILSQLHKNCGPHQASLFLEKLTKLGAPPSVDLHLSARAKSNASNKNESTWNGQKSRKEVVLALVHQKIAKCEREGGVTLDLSGLSLPRVHGLENLLSLRKLDLSNNHLTEIPDSICQLPSLCVLDVSKNAISEISSLSVPSLKRLEKINLLENPLKDPFAFLFKASNENRLLFFQHFESCKAIHS